MSEAPFPQNPYAAPGVSAEAYAPPVRSGLPTYCIVIFIMDIVFSLIRLPLAALSFLAMTIGREQMGVEMANTVPFELLTHAGMGIFGIVGDIAMLLKQRWGLLFGWLKAISVCASLIVAVWQLHITAQELPPNSPEQIGAYFGGALTFVVRLCLLGLFIAALVVFARWSKQRITLGAEPPVEQW